MMRIGESGNSTQILETMPSGKQRQPLTSDKEQSWKCCKGVGELESPEASSLSMAVEREYRETLFRDILESGKPMMVGTLGEMERVEKKLMVKKGYAKLIDGQRWKAGEQH